MRKNLFMLSAMLICSVVSASQNERKAENKLLESAVRGTIEVNRELRRSGECEHCAAKTPSLQKERCRAPETIGSFFWARMRSLKLDHTGDLSRTGEIIPTIIFPDKSKTLLVSKELFWKIKKGEKAHPSSRSAYFPFSKIHCDQLNFQLLLEDEDVFGRKVLFNLPVHLNARFLAGSAEKSQIVVLKKPGIEAEIEIVTQKAPSKDVRDRKTQDLKFAKSNDAAMLLDKLVRVEIVVPGASSNSSAMEQGQTNYMNLRRMRNQILAFRDTPEFSDLKQIFNDKVETAMKKNIVATDWINEEFPLLPSAGSLLID
ncbi:MAG TPA: hypothetical protein VJB59_09825 [Bdellovibrionota bacterium]|nr:hypothetical protein [Bdellovibrionota bacterium]